MRQLPAPSQSGRFLALDQGAGAYHVARLAAGVTLGLAGGATAAMTLTGGSLIARMAGVLGAALALAAAAYLAGLLLPFSRLRARLLLRAYAMVIDRFILRTLLRAVGLVGDKTDPLLRLFVQANNASVRALYRRHKPNKLVILLPHCVVWTRCPKKVVKDLASCTECDLCQMEEILGVADRASLPVAIAIRSDEAYAQARSMGPELTVAVACDDRLVKGITRVPELPAIALPLHLPEESCHDNLVDLSGLHETLSYFLGTERVTGRAAVPMTATVTDDRAAADRRVRLPVLSSQADASVRPAGHS